MAGTELDEILAESATPETQEQTTQEAVTQETGQARDGNGRFAARAETPAETQEQPQETVEEEHDAGDGKVPQQALHASRQKEKEARQEAETLKQQIAELRGQVQLLSNRPQQPQTPQEPAKAPDFWEDPDGYLKGALSPVQQAMQQRNEYFSKQFAIQQHGAETVEAAEKAVNAALANATPEQRAEALRERASSIDPFGNMVKWYKQQQTLQMVGNDPNAWLEAELEKRLTDPAQQAKIMERLKAAATANTDRSNPVTNLPPSLNRLPAGGNTAQDNDTSDEALFSFATR